MISRNISRVRKLTTRFGQMISNSKTQGRNIINILNDNIIATMKANSVRSLIFSSSQSNLAAVNARVSDCCLKVSKM
jgi:hypothetical protein